MARDQIFPLAYKVSPLQAPYFRLRVPAVWWQAARNLSEHRAQSQRERWQRERYPSIPVTSLNQLMASAVPDVIVTIRGAWSEPGKIWLQSLEPAAPSLIALQVRAWLFEEFASTLGTAAVQEEVANLRDEDWCWESAGVQDLLSDAYCFTAVPQYIARHFPAEPVMIGGRLVQFVRYHGLTDGAELVSWPPLEIPLDSRRGLEDDSPKGYASLVIRIAARTIPGCTPPLVYLSLGLRRYFSQPLRKVKRNTGVYVGASWRWLDGARQPFSLIKLPVKWSKEGMGWPEALCALIRQRADLPDPQPVIDDPLGFQRPFTMAEGVQWAVAHDNRYKFNHPIAAGVGRRDVADLYTLVRDRLGDLLEPAGTTEKVQPIRSSQPWRFKRTKGSDERLVPMQRPEVAGPAFFSPHGAPIHTLLVLWETEETRDALLSEIRERLALTRTDTPDIFRGVGGEVLLSAQRIDPVLGGPLAIDQSGSGKRKALASAIEDRAQQIARQPWASMAARHPGLAGALVEIGRPEIFGEQGDLDPKQAWRIGVARAGFVNQHLHAVSDGAGELSRVRSSVSDLLRQLGVYYAPVFTQKHDGIAPDAWLLAFAVLRRTKRTTASGFGTRTAIIVRIQPQTGVVEATTPALFQAGAVWRPYADVLRQLLDEGWRQEKAGTELSDGALTEFAMRTIRDCLYSPIDQCQEPRVLFLAEAQNARLGLTWLQDKQLRTAEPLQVLLDQYFSRSEQERFWLVRVRTAERCEVPTYRVGDDLRGQVKGLFRWYGVTDIEAPLYLSTSSMETSAMKYLRNGESRLSFGRSMTWNNRPLEIAVLHATGVSPDLLAYLVHRLRRRWPYVNLDTTLPAPLRFALQSREYVLDAQEYDGGDDEIFDVVF